MEFSRLDIRDSDIYKRDYNVNRISTVERLKFVCAKMCLFIKKLKKK